MQFVLVQSFSPNRAEMIFTHFRRMLAAVFDGGSGQPKLKSLVPAGKLETMAENFLDRLQPSGSIERLSYATFNNAARALLNELSELAMELQPGAPGFLRPAKRRVGKD